MKCLQLDLCSMLFDIISRQNFYLFSFHQINILLDKFILVQLFFCRICEFCLVLDLCSTGIKMVKFSSIQIL